MSGCVLEPPRLSCRSGSGRLSFREFRGGGELMDALYALDREDDINKVGGGGDGRMDSCKVRRGVGVRRVRDLCSEARRAKRQ